MSDSGIPAGSLQVKNALSELQEFKAVAQENLGLTDTNGSTLQQFIVENQGTVTTTPPLFSIVGALNEDTVLTRHWQTADGSDFFPAFRRAIQNRVAAWGGRIRVPATQQLFGVSNIVYLTPDNTLATSANGIQIEVDSGVTVQSTLTATVDDIAYGYAPLFVINGNDCGVRGRGAKLQSLGVAPGSVAGLPYFQIWPGINPHAAVYQAFGDRYFIEDVSIDTFQVGVSICGNIANMSISNPADQILALNGSVARIHLTNYGFGVLHQLNDGLVMREITGEGSQEISGDLNPPHLIYGTNRGCRASQNLLVIGCREIDNSYAAGIKARNWINSNIIGNHLGGLPTAVGQDRGIQVEWSRGVIVAGNALTISPVTTNDGDPAAILFVDCQLCTEYGNWASTTGNASGVAITRDETDTVTFLAADASGTNGVPQTGAANQATLGIINSNYAIAANALATLATTSQVVSTGCIIFIVDGTGAGQSQVVTANPAAAAGAVMGNVTVAADWEIPPDDTSVLHLYDPRCGQNRVGFGSVIVGNQNTGLPGQAAVSIQNSDYNYVRCPSYTDIGDNTVAYPFHTEHAIYTIWDDPCLVNAAPNPSNSTKCVEVVSTCAYTTVLYHPARWPDAIFDDSGIGTQIINLSECAPDLIGLATNITPAATLAYNIGSGSLAWNEVYAGEFQLPGTSGSTSYNTTISPAQISFGSPSTSYLGFTSTGGLAVQFGGITFYSFASNQFVPTTTGVFKFGSSTYALGNVFSDEFSLPGTNSDGGAFTTTIEPTLIEFGQSAQTYIKWQSTGSLNFQSVSSGTSTTVLTVSPTGANLTTGNSLKVNNEVVIDGNGYHHNPAVAVESLVSASTAGLGTTAFATNGCNTGEGAGAGTGCLVFVKSVSGTLTWCAVWSGVAVTT